MSLVLAVLMVLTVTAALAVNSNGELNEYNGLTSTDNVIGIAKQIVLVNAEDTTVRLPNITYTYTIETTVPDSAKITGKDADDFEMTLPVNAGPLTAVRGATTDTTSQISYADTETSTATSTGTSTTAKFANFTFTPATFAAPGIYRYKITESTNVTKNSVGITEAATYAVSRYLDVYVKWTDDEHTTLGIYGYVLFEGSQTDSITHTNTAMKSTGYVNTATSGQADVDVYTTQNLVITKKTTGSLANVNNDFPVTITFTKASGLSNGIKLDYSVTNNGGVTQVDSDTVGNYVILNTAISGTVRNTSTITITGIPANSTVSLTEKNNTVDYYRVKAGTTDEAADVLQEATVAPNANSAATAAQTLSAKVQLFITNTLSEISPTGYATRFAPYALILVAGIALLVIAMKKRKTAEE